ncbi:hypothetical protein [Methylophilus sp. 5]|uniref:hypothetical protein n=1 Tax=Methylophilus sp. 5 TaxID=1112274 RepID=UPI00048B58B2|nr:hypothetical protein [Methylophilus sp. 5]
MYTIEDLKLANAQLNEVAERWSAAHSANRVNPLDMEAKAAAERVHHIEEDLKRRGLLRYTAHELLDESLDQRHPDAQSWEVVLYNGKRYRRRFYPLELSKSGKRVKQWRKAWEPLDD